jgi:hypothetical protein
MMEKRVDRTKTRWDYKILKTISPQALEKVQGSWWKQRNPDPELILSLN